MDTFAPESHNNCNDFPLTFAFTKSSSFPMLLSSTISDLTFSKVELRSPDLTCSRFPAAETWMYHFVVQ